MVSTVFKWLWSMKTTSKTGTGNLITSNFKNSPIQGNGLVSFWLFLFTAIHSRSMVKFEGGYTVETVFDGTKAGIEPYSLEVSPAGEILVLDSENSNIYRIPTPLSRCEFTFFERFIRF